jgi:hypothetical protein
MDFFIFAVILTQKKHVFIQRDIELLLTISNSMLKTSFSKRI